MEFKNKSHSKIIPKIDIETYKELYKFYCNTEEKRQSQDCIKFSYTMWIYTNSIKNSKSSL